MVATVLGPKAYFKYTSDNGKNYAVYGLANDWLAAGNATCLRTAFPAKPSSLKMRFVWGVTATGARRKFYIGSTANGFYRSGGSISVGAFTFTVGLTSGRVGEKDSGGVSE